MAFFFQTNMQQVAEIYENTKFGWTLGRMLWNMLIYTPMCINHQHCNISYLRCDGREGKDTRFKHGFNTDFSLVVKSNAPGQVVRRNTHLFYSLLQRRIGKQKRFRNKLGARSIGVQRSSPKSSCVHSSTQGHPKTWWRHLRCTFKPSELQAAIFWSFFVFNSRWINVHIETKWNKTPLKLFLFLSPSFVSSGSSGCCLMTSSENVEMTASAISTKFFGSFSRWRACNDLHWTMSRGMLRHEHH